MVTAVSYLKACGTAGIGSARISPAAPCMGPEAFDRTLVPRPLGRRRTTPRRWRWSRRRSGRCGRPSRGRIAQARRLSSATWLHVGHAGSRTARPEPPPTRSRPAIPIAAVPTRALASTTAGHRSRSTTENAARATTGTCSILARGRPLEKSHANLVSEESVRSEA